MRTAQIPPPVIPANHPPEQMIPAGRKVYTGSQLRQKAKDILLEGYKKEASDA